MKSVLLHIHDDEGQESRFQAATDIVRAFDGHLTCVQAAPYEYPIFGDPFGGAYVLPTVLAEVRREQKETQKRLEERLDHVGVNWNWTKYDGPAAKMLIDHSRLADLIVLSHVPDTAKGHDSWPPLTADVAVHSRAPVLAVPADTKNFPCDGKAIIAWNGSFEASEAVKAALPLLRMASSVTIVSVTESELVYPATDASIYLARHGIASDLVNQPAKDRSVSDALRTAIQSHGGDYLVMGAYGHSRIREKILGGVTRDLLRNSSVPLLMAH